MPYEAEQYYSGQFQSAEPTEKNGVPAVEVYVKGDHGGIGGVIWLEGDYIDDTVKTLWSYGLTDSEILGLAEDGGPLVGKPCRFKTKLREYQDRNGELKQKMQIKSFWSLRNPAPPPSDKAKSKAKSALSAAMGAPAPQPKPAENWDPDPGPGDEDMPF